jgi:anthranilate phosphoribosyltransferase
MKGETADEVVGFVRTMREHMVLVRPKTWDHIDTCGTGGDAPRVDGEACNTFNISTAAAFGVAGAGVPVAKHGNRAMSSKCGSADVLESLGVPIEGTPEQLADTLDTVGITFMFAQRLHPAMRHAGPVRKELGVRTVFNTLGPLTNPARANRQLIGVGDPDWLVRTATALGRLGSERAMVVHGEPGLDELSTLGESRVAEWRDGALHEYTLNAEDLGLPRANLQDLAGGGVEDNARILEAVLSGESGPRRDITLLNAAAALLVAGKAEDWAGALALAAHSIDTGAAHNKLDRLRAVAA